MHDAKRNARRDTGINGVAAGLQHANARLGRQIVAGGDHMAMALNHRLQGKRQRIGLLRVGSAASSKIY